MKQVLQNLRTGQLDLAEVPAPGVGRNTVLIQTRASLISAGTERMLVEFGQASLLAKARAQPDKVKQVLDKIRAEGLLPTLETVFSRLDEPLPLGYCNAGVVLEVGENVSRFAVGDRVISNGPHAEIVAVPENLCAAIPDGVSDEQAAFTVLSSIGLQGIRLIQPTLGETVAVVGLGLIGLVTAQMLMASGCRVLGVDISPSRVALAQSLGCETAPVGGDPVAAAMTATGGRGVDGVIITASAKTDEIVHQAADMCRKRGRIVLVGVVGLNLRRSDFYRKELSFQVSCSYGPGRYDDRYEQGGQDYPLAFVRWTEQRNFEAVLGLMRAGQLTVSSLISQRFPLEQAASAYESVSGGESLGIVLTYPETVDRARSIEVPRAAAVSGSGAGATGRAVVGVIGAGNFSKMTLMPALSKAGAEVRYLADLDGASAQHLARKFGVSVATSDYQEMLRDPQVQAVIVAVRHNLHARFVIEVLRAGKHVFVEKPLALNVQEVRDILAAVRESGDRQVMVGFNRRFSPHTERLRKLLAGRSEPLSMTMLVNAGFSPADSWVHDPKIGGGRIIGEGCHFIDLMAYLAGSKVATVSAGMVGRGPAVREDKMAITIVLEDGSVGSVQYYANGAKNYPKEQLVVFSDGRVVELDNFRKLTGYGFRGFGKFKTFRMDKGHRAEFAAFVRQVAEGGPSLVPLDNLVNVTLASFAAVTSAAENRTIVLADEYAASLSE
ncbi:MAG: bi-domain-containing oxidoreductase [Planctomycetes bacterium]|nr:bi-domain-containing oxidoreductase [Planctomycetota bacterium]